MNGSTIKTNKVSSNVELVQFLLSTTLADTVANSKWNPIPNAQDFLFVLQQNTNANGGVLTGFYFEVIDNRDVNGELIALDVNGDLVLASSINPGTGVGATPVPDNDLTICLVKDRFEQCHPTKVDSTATPPVVLGDTGQVGNQYLLELQQPELIQARECKAPTFYRLGISTQTGAEDFQVAMVATGHHIANPPITKERVS